MSRNSRNNSTPLTPEQEIDEPIRTEAAPAHESVVASADPAPSGSKPFDPGFLPEGTRLELEQYGVATNPFTGERLTKTKE